MYFVTGTQAESENDNVILLMKLSELYSTKRDGEDSDGFDPDSDDHVDDDPIMEYKRIGHSYASTNRIRAMPQKPTIIADMASDSIVRIFDIKDHREALDKPGHPYKKSSPIYQFKGHPVEGRAIAWCQKTPGRLISGDCSSNIYLWEPTGSTIPSWNVDPVPYSGHEASIEDVCWSPSQGEVFASSSVDGTVKLWDLRKGKKFVASIAAHDVDVNVISWNHKRAFLLASGCDDGGWKVWDLRQLGDNMNYQFRFNWHRDAITSIEWNPNDDSEIAVSSADNSISIWDLSLTMEKTKVDGIDIPSQLLFVHRGQENIKEVHWHPQIPGTLVSTAADGFNIFKPSNISTE